MSDPKGGAPPLPGPHPASDPAGGGSLPDAALPPARDPRMDRPRAADDAGWLLVMVPRDARRPVERVELAPGSLRRWRVGAALLGLLVAAMAAALLFAWPRSAASTALLDENLELKQRLDDIDRKMAEVDRVLLRLRLYDAQLESLGAPTGDHGGPLPEDGLANAELDDEGLVSAAPWADSIEARADAFLDTVRRAEPELARLLGEQESLEALRQALPSILPSGGRLTSGYGWRRNPFGAVEGGRARGRWRHHSGLDIAGEKGSPIVAAAPGVVVRAGWSGGYGRAVEIDHGFGITSLYGHCSELSVAVGQEVVRGAPIALMGTSGHSTGPHVHFEVRIDGHPVDPLDYVR